MSLWEIKIDGNSCVVEFLTTQLLDNFSIGVNFLTRIVYCVIMRSVMKGNLKFLFRAHKYEKCEFTNMYRTSKLLYKIIRYTTLWKLREVVKI